MTNPPSVPSLDVEARVRLLKELLIYKKLVVGDITPQEETLIRDFASALPGMGKDSERDKERRKWLATTCATVHADEDGFYVSWRDDREPWARRRCATDSFSSANEAIDAARAAQPKETSDV